MGGISNRWGGLQLIEEMLQPLPRPDLHRPVDDSLQDTPSRC